MRFKTNSLLPDPRTLIFYNLVRLQKTERKQLGVFREGGVGQESPWVGGGGEAGMYFDISGFQCKITEKAVIYPNNDY